MINPVYQQMVVNVSTQQLLPMTTNRKISQNDLQTLANKTPNMPEQVISSVNFLLTFFNKIAILGDQDNTSISEQDIQAFSQQGINLVIDA
ncbi:MAG: hypothetical protein AB1782_06150 [Cyanobacteriota bacterium]